MSFSFGTPKPATNTFGTPTASATSFVGFGPPTSATTGLFGATAPTCSSSSTGFSFGGLGSSAFGAKTTASSTFGKRC